MICTVTSIRNFDEYTVANLDAIPISKEKLQLHPIVRGSNHNENLCLYSSYHGVRKPHDWCRVEINNTIYYFVTYFDATGRLILKYI